MFWVIWTCWVDISVSKQEKTLVYRERFLRFSTHCHGIKWTIHGKDQHYRNCCSQSETFLRVKNSQLRRELKAKCYLGIGIATLNCHKSVCWLCFRESFINTWVTSRITAKFIIMLNIWSVFSLSVSFCPILPSWKIVSVYLFFLINSGETVVNTWLSLYISFCSLPPPIHIKALFRGLNAMHWKTLFSKQKTMQKC